MKRATSNATSLVLLVSCVAWTNCGGEGNPSAPTPIAPRSLAGTYAFVSVTEKVTNTTIHAGDIADFDGSGTFPEGAITGSLEMTESNATFTWITTPIGATPVPAVSEGTYTTNGSSITFAITSSTITTTTPVGTDTFTFGLSGNRLTLDDDEKTFVYDRESSGA